MTAAGGERRALTRFPASKAPVVAGWVTSADEARHWCGRREHPFPPGVVPERQADADSTAYLLLADGDPAGYGEVWLDAEEDEAELAHLIVAPGFRGHGVGRELVTRLTAQARKSGPGQIVMRVNPANDQAMRCYRAAGFIRVDSSGEMAWNCGQPIDYVWLRSEISGSPGRR